MNGYEWKVAKPTRQPRFIAIQAATGESMPPDSRHTALPSVPTGSPPSPSMRSTNTKLCSGRTSIPSSSSAPLSFGPGAGRAPRGLARRRGGRTPGELNGKRFSARFVVTRKVIGVAGRTAVQDVGQDARGQLDHGLGVRLGHPARERST